MKNHNMKKILTITALALLALSAAGQDIISERDTIVARLDTIICQGDTTTKAYYLVSIRVVDNGTPYPDTSQTTILIKQGNCPADSSQVARQIYVGAVNQQLQLSRHMSEAFQRGQILRAFNNASTLYQALTGLSLLDATSEELFQDYTGRYRVFTSTGSFFADINRLGNGRWRLRQLTGRTGTPTGTVWVMNPRSRNNFGITNIDLGFGATNYEFFRDLRPGAESIFWPVHRVSGATGAVRIVKID